jgi:hypothetical protein
MLIGLMSDSHDNVPQIKKAVSYFNKNNVDLVLHAGDIVAPFCADELIKLKSKFVAVFGNNDGEKNMWRQRVKGWGEIFEGYYEAVIEGEKLLLMHEPYHLEELAISGAYGVIVYGHTHKPAKQMIGKTLTVNPGETGGWTTGKSTVAIMDLPGKEVEFIKL